MAWRAAAEMGYSAAAETAVEGAIDVISGDHTFAPSRPGNHNLAIRLKDQTVRVVRTCGDGSHCITTTQRWIQGIGVAERGVQSSIDVIANQSEVSVGG